MLCSKTQQPSPRALRRRRTRARPASIALESSCSKARRCQASHLLLLAATLRTVTPFATSAAVHLYLSARHKSTGQGCHSCQIQPRCRPPHPSWSESVNETLSQRALPRLLARTLTTAALTTTPIRLRPPTPNALDTTLTTALQHAVQTSRCNPVHPCPRRCRSVPQLLQPTKPSALTYIFVYCQPRSYESGALTDLSGHSATAPFPATSPASFTPSGPSQAPYLSSWQNYSRVPQSFSSATSQVPPPPAFYTGPMSTRYSEDRSSGIAPSSINHSYPPPPAAEFIQRSQAPSESILPIRTGPVQKKRGKLPEEGRSRS